MLVSADQLKTDYVPLSSDYWFRDREERNEYFGENSSELVSGIYVAICGNPEEYEAARADSSIQAWELEQFNGTNWQVYTVDENYNLTITTYGLEVLANATTGATTLSFSGIKIIDTCLTNPATPLAMWKDRDFVNAGNVVFSVGAYEEDGSASPFYHNAPGDLKQILTWRYNSGTGGLQYAITLPAEGLGSVSNANEAVWNIGAIGLYVKDPASGNHVLFGIATLQTPAQKIGNDINTIGNSFKFYINTVLTNLGYVQDLSVIQEQESSIPELDNETFLLYPEDDSKQRPFNLYLVDNLYGTGIPALAVQSKNYSSSSTDQIDWNFFQPSDNYLKVDPDKFAADVQNYCFVYWDASDSKYKKAEGKSGTGVVNPKKPIGIRVGNSIVFSGEIGNNSTSYTYNKPTIVNGGSGYNKGDQLLLLYTVNNETKIVFKVIVTGVIPSSGTIVDIEFVGPKSGNVDIENAVITAIYDPRSASRSGEGAQFSVTCSNLTPIEWNLEPNMPYYCGSGDRYAGQPVPEQNDSFLGWATSTKSLRLGLDLRNEATEAVYGTTRYATKDEVKDVTGHDAAKNRTAVTPGKLQENYLQITSVSGNPGATSETAITVQTHVKFNETVQGKSGGIAFQGTAYRAQWADLAEYYESDKIYEAGTLISFGEGDKEITSASTECNGVISTKPGYQLGEKLNDNYQLVTLCGRVPVLFDGKCKINRGDKVYLSKFTKGRASTVPNGKAIGKVIERNPGTMTKIECVVKIDF